MLWRWLLVPVLPWLLREPGAADPPARLPPRALLGRVACGVLWFDGLHGAVRELGDAAANAIYHDPGAAFLAAGRSALGVLLTVAVAWAWTKRTPRRRDAGLAGAVILVCVALGIPSARVSGPPPARFGRVLAMPPSVSLVESVPNRPVVRYELNDHGFRGPSWSDARPAGVVRGVLIGDSFVFGSGVELPDTLAESLRRALAERAPGQPYELLNLGIGGDNLGSHVDVYEEAVRRLSPDFVVLCLTLPNDMSAYDDQVTRRAERELGAFTAARWAVGPWLATWMWCAGRLSSAETPEALAVLDREIGRLSQDRADGRGPPLLVFTYRDPGDRVRRVLEGIPGAIRVAPPTEEDAFFLPIDGHPTGVGNRAFAARLAAALVAAPGLPAPR